MEQRTSKIVEKRNRIANIVKKNMWGNNARATTRGQEPGGVLMNNKYLVWCTEDESEKMPKGYHYMALVLDYGDHFKIKLFNKKGTQLKAAFYRIGRLGLAVA